VIHAGPPTGGRLAFVRAGFIVLVVLACALAGHIVPALFALSLGLVFEAALVASSMRSSNRGRARTGLAHLVCGVTVLAVIARPERERVVDVERSAAESDLKFLGRAADELAR
jgi:hypothetical protein